MNDFLLTGRLGAIGLGMPMQGVQTCLGPPEDTSVGLRRWSIWAYGPNRCLQISHYDKVVRLIGIYFPPSEPVFPILPAVLKIKIPFSGQTTAADLKLYLSDHGIDCVDGREMPGGTSVKVGANVVATFEDGWLSSLIAHE